MSFIKLAPGVVGLYNGGKPQISTLYFDINTVTSLNPSWNEKYSPFLNLTTTVLHEVFLDMGLNI